MDSINPVAKRFESDASIRLRELPVEVRKQLYDKAVILNKERGLRYSQLIEYFAKEFKVDISYSSIKGWLKGKHRPDGNCYNFDLQPSPDLNRVIGEVLGDGYLKKPMRYSNQLQQGRIRFAVTDRELAEDFATRAARLLVREPYKIYLRDKKRNNPRYEVQATSIQLWDFLNQPLEVLKQYIGPYSTDFLSAIFDTEGGPTVSLNRRGKTVRLQLQVVLSNTDKLLVGHVKELLNCLGIHCEITARSPRTSVRLKCDGCEREIRPAKPSWQLAIYRRDSLKKFSEKISFLVKRKQEKLTDALNLMESFGPTKAAELWLEVYEKRGTIWVRRPRMKGFGRGCQNQHNIF